MAEDDLKKYLQTVDRIDDLVSADVPRNVLRVALAAQDVGQLDTNLEQINGTTQTADDWTPYFTELSALAGALKTNDSDEIISRIAGADGVEIADGALDTTPGATDAALVTILAQALNDIGQDELVSRITDSAGSQVDPATTALENALKANDADEFVTRVTGSDGLEVQEEQLDTTVNATDVALLTYLSRALNDVGQDELVSRLTDSAGSQIDPATNTDQPNYFNDTLNSVDIIGNGTYDTGEQNIRGCGDLVIKVDSDDDLQFSVDVEWTDGAGNVLFTQRPAELNTVTRVNAKFNVGLDDVQVKIIDESGDTANNISGGINAH